MNPDDLGRSNVFVLDQSIKVLYQSILVLSIYFLLAGHNLPGGGFVGGLIAGAAISLRYVTGGANAVRATFPVPSHVILGAGLAMSALTALVPVVLGGAVLEHGEYETDLPVFGAVKFVSALPFDIGVYLVVVGLMLMAFAAFGDDDPDQPDAATDPGHDDDEPLEAAIKVDIATLEIIDIAGERFDDITETPGDVDRADHEAER